jgi:hypothetical protein
MYKRPPLRVKEEPRISSRPKPGTFLDKIVNPPPTVRYVQKKYPVYQKDTYLALLKRNCIELGLEYKEPDIPNYVPPQRPKPVEQPQLTFSDKVYMKVRILKSGIIRVKLDTSFAILYEKYYSKQKQPPMKSLIQAYKSIGFTPEFLEKIKTKFSKFAEHKKKVEKMIDEIFNKEPVKKPKKSKKKEEEEFIEDEVEPEEDREEDEEDPDDDPGEDGEMDVEIDNDDDNEEQQEDGEEAYLSD